MTDDPEPTLARDEPAGPSVRERYYQAVVTRVYYGSESGTLASVATGREYHFKGPFVQIVGPIPRVDGLREGMTVGFDLAWTSRGVRVNLIRVFD